jgi:hypothetical protein
MISTAIYDSSVAWNLGEKNPGFKGLAAQRILEVLIFLADDHGRGKYIAGMIRSRAYSSIPGVLDEISVHDVEMWLRQIEEEGTIKTYTIGGQKYYTLTGWRHYQRGNWRPANSNIPAPPWEEDDQASAGSVDNPADKSTNKSQIKSTEKSAVEVDEEVDAEDVTEKKGRERKGEEEKRMNCESGPDHDKEASGCILDMLQDPEVPDSKAVAEGCAGLPDPEPYGEAQLRRLEQGHELASGSDGHLLSQGKNEGPEVPET